jgi:hypothetical protein
MNNLFTNDNPETTIKNLSFKTTDDTIKSIRKIESIFNKLKNKQKINTYSPLNLRPRTYFENKESIEKFYLKQKMYRIIGLLNRAKIVYKNHPSIQLEKSINILQKWMDNYHKIK